MSHGTPPTKRLKRKRTEDEPIVPGKPRKHDRFWLDDGNVVLTADNALSFRLHRSVLSLHSEVFRSMFAFPSRPEDNEMMEGCPVIHLQDSGDDLVDFFALLYDGGTSPFFRREERISFPMVRAMLILSFKYDVQHIRDEALRRLVTWFPSSLAGWDHLRRLEQEDPLVAVTFDDGVALVNLARKFDLPGLLPVAFYQCSCMHLEDLLKPMKFGSTTEMLSQNDLAIALAGVADLDELVSQLLGVFLHHAPDRVCSDPDNCRRTMRRLLRKLHTGCGLFSKKWIFEPAENIPDLEVLAEGGGCCSSCRRYIFEAFERRRRRAWARLGEIYGVKPWPIEGE